MTTRGSILLPLHRNNYCQLKILFIKLKVHQIKGILVESPIELIEKAAAAVKEKYTRRKQLKKKRFDGFIFLKSRWKIGKWDYELYRVGKTITLSRQGGSLNKYGAGQLFVYKRRFETKEEARRVLRKLPDCIPHWNAKTYGFKLTKHKDLENLA